MKNKPPEHMMQTAGLELAGQFNHQAMAISEEGYLSLSRRMQGGVLQPMAGRVEEFLAELAIEDPAQRPERNADGYLCGVARMGDAAVIDISGVLVQYANRWNWCHGLRSYQSIRQDFDAALASDAARIVLRMDSPGGTVAGCFDLVDHIYAARAAKPVVAIANDLAASGGYAIFSAAGKGHLTQTAQVGSIGVIWTHFDYSGMFAEYGIKVTHLKAGKRKDDGSPYQALSKEAAAAIQANLDHYYDLFVAKVARGRRMEDAAVRATEAGMFVGSVAQERGLADSVTNFEKLVAAPKRTPELSLTGPQARQIDADAAAQAAAEQESKTMAEETTIPEASTSQAPATPQAAPAAPAPAPEANPQGESNVLAEAKARNADITALCKLAGVDADATLAYINSEKSVADVRADLLARQEGTGGGDVSNRVEAHAGTEGAGNREALAAAANKIASQSLSGSPLKAAAGKIAAQ